MSLGRWWWGARVVLASACVAMLGCNSPTSSRLTLHVELTDPAGDAPTSPVVPNPPDLTGATVEVLRGNVTFTLRFAPGWDPATSFVTIDLDVDQDASTGVPGAGLGVEYEVEPGGVVRFDGMTTTVVGAPAVSTSSDGMTLRLPLSMLGGDDGQMNLRVRVHHTLQLAFDLLPDASQPPGRVE